MVSGLGGNAEKSYRKEYWPLSTIARGCILSSVKKLDLTIVRVSGMVICRYLTPIVTKKSVPAWAIDAHAMIEITMPNVFFIIPLCYVLSFWRSVCNKRTYFRLLAFFVFGEMNYSSSMRALKNLILIFFTCISYFAICQELTIKSAIPVPSGYLRESYPGDSYSNWIQNLQLKAKPVILDYKGRVVESGLYRAFGVVNTPLLFNGDLEQCADFAMRLWAEYHKSAGKLDKLYLFDYSGHKQQFAQSGKSYNSFLKQAFANTNSYSLKSGCATVAPDSIIPGDMFVQNERGGIGHVSVVVDVCRSKQGGKLYLIGFSFMPAQEFHIEKAEEKYGVGGWFTFEGYAQYLLDNLNYGKPALRRFDPL
jgi:hypothetical protein